jgi:hypothetical protein
MKLLNLIKKDLNSDLRIFIYKCLIVFILLISFYQYTIGSKLDKIDNLLARIENLSELNEDTIQKEFFSKFENRLDQENFFNPEYIKIIIKSYNKILEEFDRENSKIEQEKN